MQYLRLANYKVTKGTFSGIADIAKGSLLDKFRAQPGFLRFGLADTGGATYLSVSLWETYAQAEAAPPVDAIWVSKHIPDQVDLISDEIGDLAFFEGPPATV
jgi:hypothetical protein